MKPIDQMIIPADQVAYAETADAVDAATDAMKMNAAMLKGAHLPQVRAYLTDALDQAGASIEAAAKVIGDAQKANIVVIHEGQAHESSAPDHRTRLKGAELNLKARGELKDQDAVNIFMKIGDEDLARIANGTLDPAKIIDLGPRVNEIRDSVPEPLPEVPPAAAP